MTDAPLATLRQHLLQALHNPPGDETRRLFHGRGRCWPGLEQITVDWLSGIVLVMLFREPDAALRPLLLELLDIEGGDLPWLLLNAPATWFSGA